MYLAIFPKAVHSLPNGLTIYKLSVASHDKKFNCSIGGPHETFQHMASNFGSMTLVFANLCQQLNNYKQFGPPSISKAIMTVEELEFATKFKNWDTEIIDHQNFNSNSKVVDLTDSKEGFVDSDLASNVNCYVCGIDLIEENIAMEVLGDTLLTTEEDDGLRSFKKQLQKAQQEGLDIQYRCPKCRDCSSCRRSHETERISLREETEDHMIWESVQIDWENKRIVAYLPLRGEEREFMTNNREIALTILDQQCLKYHKDDETRELIVKAFDKLKKNGQCVLWKNLSDEQKKLAESKEISHYIVWRVVFKPSLSSPARPVFDASQNTKHRPDGSGGRCLNDAVVKGRVTTLNLVKMVLRFSVGTNAVQGDLKQFYASILLDKKQWNLQRVLYRDNLDPSAEVQEFVIKTLIWGIKSVKCPV